MKNGGMKENIESRGICAGIMGDRNTPSFFRSA
jgi:hypothetical protein